jgi:hypothetical protein
MNARRITQSLAALVLAVSGVVAITQQATAAVDDAAFVSQVAPPQTMFSGQTVSVQVTMRNTGSIAWTPSDHALRSRGPSGNSNWGMSTVPLASVVQPGQTATFSFTATAPTTGGNYVFQWGIATGLVAAGGVGAGAVEIGQSSPAVNVLVTQFANGYQIGYRDLSGTLLNDLFTGNAHIESDSSYNATSVVGHAETSTVFYAGQYLMFYRDFQGAPTCPSGAGGIAIGLARSVDGNTWVADNAGNPVFSVAGGLVYSPSVIIDRDSLGLPRLDMTYEINPNCTSDQHIGRAYSYDGDTWTASSDLIFGSAAGSGAWDSRGIGTPTLVRGTDGVYRVMYHGFNGTDGTNGLADGFASSSTLDAVMTNKTGPDIGNATANPVGSWANVGPGKGDIVHEGSYWYLIVEGLSGHAICVNGEVSAWGLARTTDPTLRTGWSFSSFNPVRTDRIGSNCGEDMPSFQVIGGTPYLLVTPEDPFRVPRQQEQRYRVVEGARGQSSDPIVGVAATPDGNGYYEVTAHGYVYSFGSAVYHGGWNGQPLNKPICGMAVTPDGGGYWLVAQDGGIFTFGNAVGYGSTGGQTLNAPVVGMASSPDGGGYWLVAADGGIFVFGDAAQGLGSLGGTHLNQPVVGMASSPDGRGYWLVAADGGIFPFGDAAQGLGSLGGQTLNAPIVGMARTSDGQGYWLVGRDGGIFPFGDAPGIGSTEGQTPRPIVGITARPGGGYWIAANDGGIVNFGAPYFHDPHYTGP